MVNNNSWCPPSGYPRPFLPTAPEEGRLNSSQEVVAFFIYDRLSYPIEKLQVIKIALIAHGQRATLRHGQPPYGFANLADEGDDSRRDGKK